jgi:hypothetical protein
MVVPSSTWLATVSGLTSAPHLVDQHGAGAAFTLAAAWLHPVRPRSDRSNASKLQDGGPLS